MRYTPIKQVWLSPELPDKIADVLEAVEFDLANNGDYPDVRVVGIESDWEGEDADGENLIIHVEIIPGLILPYWHSDEGELPLEEAVDWIVDEVRRGVEAASLQSARYLEDANRVRHEAKRMMADWQAEGLPASFARLLMEDHQGWYVNGNPGFRVEIETLGQRLEPAIESIFIASPAELPTKLAPLHDRLRQRNDKRIAIGQSGSDGLIDDMALAALLREDKPHSVFRRLLKADMVKLGDGVVLGWSDGQIWCGDGQGFGAKLSVCGDRITANGMYLDAKTSSGIIGKPASTRFQHPLLTDNVRIASVEKHLNEGVPVTEATLTMTIHNFCAATGRTWPQIQDTPAHARPKPILRIVQTTRTT